MWKEMLENRGLILRLTLLLKLEKEDPPLKEKVTRGRAQELGLVWQVQAAAV